MKGFRKLVVLGVLLVTLLFVIDTIDAGRKQPKREVENKNLNENENSKNTKYDKIKKLESLKSEKKRKTNIYKSEHYGDGNKQFSKDAKFEAKNYKLMKGTKHVTKDGNYVEGVSPKNSKTRQKVNKYKVAEDNPAKEFIESITKVKKTKSQVVKEEQIDETLQPTKKNSQKKLTKEKGDIEDIINEELSILNGEETFIEEENSSNNPKRRKYKLVEVVLEEDRAEEDKEGNETIIEVGSEDEEIQRTESEEVFENFKTTQTVKFPKNRKLAKKPLSLEEEPTEESTNEDYYFNNKEETSESGYSGDTSSDSDSFPSRYEDPESLQRCKPLPEDPNRQGPKKLTLYVIEEEVNGKIIKRVIPEEDGVTMCEVADLLKSQFYAGLTNE